MRILLVAPDVELALELLASLEDAEHRVEHIFDLEEGLLHAAIAWPDAVVVALGGASAEDDAADHEGRRSEQTILRRWAQDCTIPLVLVDTSDEDPGAPSALGATSRLARRLDAAFVARRDREDEAWAARFVDVIETAVRRAAEQADASPAPFSVRKRSGTVAVPRPILIAVRDSAAAEVIGPFLRSALGLRCVAATSAAEAAALLREDTRLTAMLLDRRLLAEAAGRELAIIVQERLIQIVPLRLHHDEDAASIGRAAWEAVPALRAAIAARRAANR